MTKILNSILLWSLSLFPIINSYSNPDRENTHRVGSPFWHFFTGSYNYQEWYGHDNFDGQIFNGLTSYGCFCNHFIGFGGYHKRPDAAVDYIDELCRQTELALECVFHDVAKPEYEDDAQAWDAVRNINLSWLDDEENLEENIDYGIYGYYYLNPKGRKTTSGGWARQLQHHPMDWHTIGSPWDSYPWWYDRDTAESFGFSNHFYPEFRDGKYVNVFNTASDNYTSEQDRQTTIIARCEEAFGVEDPNKSNYQAEMCIVFEYFISKIREWLNNGNSNDDLDPLNRDLLLKDDNNCFLPFHHELNSTETNQQDGLQARDMEWVDLEPVCAGRYPSRRSYGTPFANDYVEKKLCGYRIYDPVLYVCCDPTTEELAFSQENCGPVNCDTCVHNCWEACGWEYPALKTDL